MEYRDNIGQDDSIEDVSMRGFRSWFGLSAMLNRLKPKCLMPKYLMSNCLVLACLYGMSRDQRAVYGRVGHPRGAHNSRGCGYRPIFFLMAFGLIASACVTTDSSISTNQFGVVENNAKILLIEPDIQLSLLRASGVVEVNPEWTALGKKHLLKAMRNLLSAGNDHQLIEHDLDANNPRELQLVKLHEVVGNSILAQRFGSNKLPTKKDIFDWTLGPGVESLAARYEADYALFFFVRGQYASAGRQALSISMAVVFGAAMSTGGQAAYGSLVDLKTGDIIWFNTATTTAGIDMRRPEGASVLAENTLKDIPLNRSAP